MKKYHVFKGDSLLVVEADEWLRSPNDAIFFMKDENGDRIIQLPIGHWFYKDGNKIAYFDLTWAVMVEEVKPS